MAIATREGTGLGVRVEDFGRFARQVLAAKFEPKPPPTLAEFLSRTLPFELHPWQRDVLVPLLQEASCAKGVRLLVHAPPRVGKSIIVSKRYPAYLMGLDPRRKIAMAAHAVQACRDTFTEAVRNVMLSPEFEEMFPDPGCRIPRLSSAERFTTAARHDMRLGDPSVIAMGLQSGMSGRGADKAGDWLIVDDPYADRDQANSAAENDRARRWVDDMTTNRLHPEANCLIMFHRYRKEDIVGMLMERDGFEYAKAA